MEYTIDDLFGFIERHDEHEGYYRDQLTRKIKGEALEEAAGASMEWISFKPDGWGSNPADQSAITAMSWVLDWLHARAAAIRAEDTRCTCDWTSEDRGGGYFELVADYDPACPQHSVHVWNPRTQVWEQP